MMKEIIRFFNLSYCVVICSIQNYSSTIGLILSLTAELQVLCYDSVCRIYSLPRELALRDLEIS